MRRRTQTAEYWQQLTLDAADLMCLDDLFLERESPLSTDTLAQAIIRHRCETEDSLIRRELTKGTVYQPKETHAVGDCLVFPALDFALGTVVGMRSGHNPEYGDFSVIQVDFESGSPPREFASQLTSSHLLNFDGGVEGLLWAEHFLTPEELFELYGPGVKQKLVSQLSPSEHMVRLGDFWLNKAMLPELHVGHLNIAEAIIDISGKPQPTEEILKELDLPAEMSQSIQVFALNHALTQGERFVDVGSTGHILWYLTRLIPPEVLYPLRRLQYIPIPYDRSVLSEELIQLEREIDDEASEFIAPLDADSTRKMTLILTYPHRRLGTLPLTARLSSLFPAGTTQRTLITLVDAHTGQQMPGWVDHQHRYLYGMEQWYQDNQIPVGAYLQLEGTDDPSKIKVGFIPRRMRREWVRVAETNGEELNFVVLKMPIACQYDETMLIWAESSAEIDELWIEGEETDRPLEDSIKHVFLELAKLNPQGTVHAKTVYSAVNVLRRCPPAPIFAELVTNPAYADVGNALWKYAENL